MNGDTVVVVFSERDIIYGRAQDGPPILDLRVDQMMTAPAVTVTRDQTALSALGLITRRRIRHLPVVENGRLIGIVSIGDLVKRRMEGIEREANMLREYIHSSCTGGIPSSPRQISEEHTTEHRSRMRRS